MQAGMTHRRHDLKCRERMEQALMDDDDEDNDWADRVQRRLDDVTDHAERSKASETKDVSDNPPGPAPRRAQDSVEDNRMEVEPSPGEDDNPEMNESMIDAPESVTGSTQRSRFDRSL